MTKLRAPESIEDAVHQAIALLGEQQISTAAGVSISLIRRWADPDDQGRRIGLHQALAIDGALVQQDHAPVFGALFEALAAPPAEEAADPVAAAVRMTVEASEVMDWVDRCMADGVLQPHELITIRAKVAGLRKRIAKLLRTLHAKIEKKGGRK